MCLCFVIHVDEPYLTAELSLKIMSFDFCSCLISVVMDFFKGCWRIQVNFISSPSKEKY